MTTFHVAETFVSINGEGRRAGQLAVFIRFCGCNLDCAYCDTKWANRADAPYTEMSAQEICAYIRSTGVQNVTLTGGEPLLQDGIAELLALLAQDETLWVEIETNGSVPADFVFDLANRPSLTMDYKTGASGMEDRMCLRNFERLTAHDTVKFVCGSQEDLETALRVCRTYDLIGRCAVYFSPVFGAIEPSEMVEFLKEHRLNGVNFQLQMHKFIWDPNQKGV
ncbi:MAG: putative 7-carboxy-7-deazaguanine synthase QueE [Butyricicoccaceae bacterium]